MARQDKILDIMSLAQLSQKDKIARLAHQWVGRAFPRQQAWAVVKCYFEKRGLMSDLVNALLAEKKRQEKIHNDRQAVKDALASLQVSPMDRYRGPGGAQAVARRKMEIAQDTFGPYVRESFNENTLSLMSLISGEDRWYKVNWIDASFKPVRSALIEVVTMGRVGPQYNRWLLYRTNGRVLVATTTGRSIETAWGSQVPENLANIAGDLLNAGIRITNDKETQEFILSDQDGNEMRRLPWMGRTVDD